MAKVLSISYNANSVKVLRVRGDDWDKHYNDITNAIKEKISKSLNDDCYIEINGKVIDSASLLKDALTQSEEKKISSVVKDGPPPSDTVTTTGGSDATADGDTAGGDSGAPMRAIILLDKENRIEWLFDEKAKASGDLFGDFVSYIKDSFKLAKDAIFEIFEIDGEDDIDNDSSLIGDSDELNVALDNDESNVAYFVIKGDIKRESFYSIKIDMNEADIKEEYEVCLSLPKNDEWIDLYLVMQSKIGDKLGNKEWEQDFTLQDTNNNGNFCDLEQFKSVLSQLDVDNGNNGVTLVLKKKPSCLCTIIIDLSEADGDSVTMTVPATTDPSDEACCLEQWETLDKVIANAISNNTWNKNFTLIDQDEIDIEKLEEFMLCLEEIKDGMISLKLKAKETSGYDPNAPKLFLIEYKGNTVSWQPNFEKDKSWKLHYSRLTRLVKKQFKGVNWKENGICYDITSDVNMDDENELTLANIEIFWNNLNNSRRTSILKFIIGDPSLLSTKPRIDEPIESNLEIERVEEKRLQIQNTQQLQLSREFKAIQDQMQDTKKQWQIVKKEFEIVENIDKWKGNNNNKPVLNKNNVPFARGMQMAVASVMKTRFEMTGSLKIIRSVMDLKPDDSDTSKAWAKVTESCNNIFEMSLVSLKASIKLMAAFLTLQDAMGKMALRKDEKNLAIAAMPMTVAMKEVSEMVGIISGSTSKLTESIKTDLASIRDVLPGGNEAKEIRAMVQAIQELQQQKKEANIELAKRQGELDEKENEFITKLSKINEKAVAILHKQRLSEMKRKRDAILNKGNNNNKNNDKNEKESDKKIEESKNDNNNDNEMTLEDALKVDIKEQLMEKKQIDNEIDYINKRIERLTKTQAENDRMKQNIVNQSTEELTKLKNQLNDEQKKASQFDASNYDKEIKKFRDLAESCRKKAVNLKDYEIRTDSTTTHRNGYYGWRWWWWYDDYHRTTTSTTTQKIQTNEKSNMEQTAAGYDLEADSWQKRKEQAEKDFKDNLSSKQNLIKERFDLLTSGSEDSTNAIKAHIDAELERIKGEIAGSKKEIEELINNKALIDKKYENIKKEVRDCYKLLKEKRAEFDNYAEECNQRIAILAKKQQKIEKSKEKWQMSEEGIIKLFTVAPKLIREAETTRENAAIVEGNLDVFDTVISKKKQAALTFEKACMALPDYSVLSKYAPYLSKYQSLEDVNEFACEDEGDFDEFVKPALIECMDLMAKEKEEKLLALKGNDNVNKDEDSKKNDESSSVSQTALERKRKKALSDVSKKFKKFCIDKPFKEIAAKELLYYKREFDEMVSGLDIFCELIYEKTNKVDSYLELAASANKSLELRKEKEDEQQMAIEDAKKKAIESS